MRWYLFEINMKLDWNGSTEMASWTEPEQNRNIYHRKLSFQLNPPQVMSEAVTYSNVSSEITSMIGHTTIFLTST